ncbi:hypothetical protein [Aestuariimicrobium ganziense]|uniref:hypothetical protein n=1 Tax=Aestuariimicrobium ganziense TaxID=2773677 RepID=UPI0019418111|nr:hypothetical protein [Aestuariimicrobium ganziense]
MRLYLSSYQLGDHPEQLVDLIGERRHGLLVSNAIDHVDDTARLRRDRELQLAQLAALGLHAEPLATRSPTPNGGTARCASTGWACSTGHSSHTWTPPDTRNQRC